MLHLRICTGPSDLKVKAPSILALAYLSLSQAQLNILDSICLIGFSPVNAVDMTLNCLKVYVRVTGDSMGDREMDPLKLRHTLSAEVAKCPSSQSMAHTHSLYSSKKIIQPGPAFSEQNV